MRFSRRCALLGMAIFGLPSAAFADCRFPPGRTSTPSQVADLLLESADRVGFAIVESRLDSVGRRPEVIDLVFPLKGNPGKVTLESRFTGNGVVIANGANSFGVEPGTIVFAVLHNRPDGPTISECSLQLMNLFPKSEIIGAMYKRRR